MSEQAPTKLYTALLAAQPVFGAATGKMVQLGQRNKSVGALLETAADVSHRRYPMASPQFSTPRVCIAPGCSKPAKKGVKVCAMHGWRLRRHGSFALPPRRPATYSIRPVVDAATGCHNWPGSTDGKGYGNLTRDGQLWKAHRWFWTQRHGEIPQGMHLDHLCRNRRCCNPDHLELVTPAENTRRGNAPNMIAHRENRCRRGHDFTPDNTLHRADGTRTCRTCENAAQMRRYHQRKAVQG